MHSQSDIRPTVQRLIVGWNGSVERHRIECFKNLKDLKRYSRYGLIWANLSTTSFLSTSWLNCIDVDRSEGGTAALVILTITNTGHNQRLPSTLAIKRLSNLTISIVKHSHGAICHNYPIMREGLVNCHTTKKCTRSLTSDRPFSVWSWGETAAWNGIGESVSSI